MLASISDSMSVSRAESVSTNRASPPSIWRAAARAAASPPAEIICMTASARDRSIRPLRNARSVNSPAARRAPHALKPATISWRRRSARRGSGFRTHPRGCRSEAKACTPPSPRQQFCRLHHMAVIQPVARPARALSAASAATTALKVSAEQEAPVASTSLKLSEVLAASWRLNYQRSRKHRRHLWRGPSPARKTASSAPRAPSPLIRTIAMPPSPARWRWRRWCPLGYAWTRTGSTR